MSDVLHIVSAVVAFGLGYIFLLVTIRLIVSPRDEYERNAARYSKWSDGLLGRAHQKRDGEFDGRVRAGMAYSKKRKSIVPNGRLSEAAVDKILRP